MKKMEFRNKPVITILLVLAFIGLAVGSQIDNRETPAPQDTSSATYRVTYVIDGDTLVATDGTTEERVRLLGVDAPERGECFFEESRARLMSLTQNADVILTADALNDNRDEYDRLLRYVYSDDILVNELLIKEGVARHLSWFPIEQNTHFSELEREAQQAGLGLWSECF